MHGKKYQTVIPYDKYNTYVQKSKPCCKGQSTTYALTTSHNSDEHLRNRAQASISCVRRVISPNRPWSAGNRDVIAGSVVRPVCWLLLGFAGYTAANNSNSQNGFRHATTIIRDTCQLVETIYGRERPAGCYEL